MTLKQTTQAQNVLLKKRNSLWVACLADFGIGRIESLTTLPTVQVRNVHDVGMCVDNCMSAFIGHPVQHVARAVQGRLHNIQVRVNAHPHACAPACLLTHVSAHEPVQACLPRCVQESMHARTYARMQAPVCTSARTHACTHARTHARIRSDCFSFGNLLWQLYTGKTPWGGLEGYVIGPKVRARKYTCTHVSCTAHPHMHTQVLSGERLPTAELFELGCPAVAVDLLPALWQAEPDDRPTMAQVPDVLDTCARIKP